VSRKVLMVDNDRDFLETWTEYLRAAGYEVHKATSLEQAEQLLERIWVHAAIIDVRLRAENDEKDISGLSLATRKAYQPLSKIILTKYPSYKYVRKALGPAVEGLPPAVRFMAKQEGPEKLIEALEDVFSNYVHINWDLKVRWGPRGELTLPRLMSSILPDYSLSWLPHRIPELEGLFRKLFYEYSQLTLGRIVTRRKGWALLTAFGYRDTGAEEQLLVSCGQRAKVNSEVQRHHSFVADSTAISLKERIETIHFGAAAYRLSECILEDTMTFWEFYHSSSLDDVSTAVAGLFQMTLRPHYSKGRENRRRPLEAFCRERLKLEDKALAQSDLEERVRGICQAVVRAGLADLDYSPHRLTIPCSEEADCSYPNPGPYLYEERVAVSPPTLCATIHGRLDAERVLVDRAGRSWVVDFGKSEIGPLIHDFSAFESSVKFDVLNGLTLSDLHEIERRLLATSDLAEEVDANGLGPETAKALRVIGQIRSQTAAIVGPETEPYLVALLYCAAERFIDYRPDLRYTRRETRIFGHALLSMGMICEQLFSWEDRLQGLPAQASESLWMDVRNMEVWVEGRRITLAGQGFRLLKYLYDHANQLCRRSDLAIEVFDVDLSGYHPAERKDLVKDTINTAIRRLRKDIEPNPSHPKYIRTVRGAGYRLVLGDIAAEVEA